MPTVSVKHAVILFLFALCLGSLFIGAAFFSFRTPQKVINDQTAQLESQSDLSQKSEETNTTADSAEEIPTEENVVPTPSASPAITLLFGGDMMFDRNIRLKMTKASYRLPLQDLEPLFAEHDAVITNLEGPITDNPSKSVGSTPGSSANFFFTFPIEIAQTLYEQNARVVNLGNNHILNFGKDGAAQTKKHLQAANIQFFGDTGTEASSQERTLILEIKGKKIGLVNYNQFTSDGLDHALEDIRTLKPQVDLTIVFTHWGNEYVPVAQAPITTTAHQFVDLGADLVIGMHPHVIQNIEEYKGKRIYYSLGNLVFDQYFSPEVKKGMLVSVTIQTDTNTLSFKEHTVSLQTDGRTTLDRDILLQN